MVLSDTMRCWVALIGRLLLALIFVLSGINKLMNFSGTAEMMAGKGLPMANVLLVISIAIELGGGLLLASGWYARYAALALFLFIIPVTLVFHPFWQFAADSMEHTINMIMFLKNLAIMGGMALVVAYAPGSCGIGCSRK